jgi:WD40 repeat protein
MRGAACQPEPRNIVPGLPPRSRPAPHQGRLPALGLSVSPNQQTVAVSHFSTISLLDVGGRRPVRSVESVRAFGQTRVGVHAVAFSTDGTHLCLGSSSGSLTLLDTTTLQPVRSPLKAHDDEITHLAFADGGRVLVSGGRFGGGVQLTDVAAWRSIKSIDVGGFQPRPAFAVSADGARLVTGSPDQAVCLWDIASGRLLAKCPQRVRSLHAAAFAPDNSLVALGDESGALYLWEMGNTQSVRRLQRHKAVIMSLAFAPDGRTLASASADHTLRLWHPDIDQEVAVLTDHGHWIFQVAFAASGQALLSCDHAGTVRVWRASD